MAIIRSKNIADYTIKIGELSANKLKIIGFSGSEGISELFRFNIDLASLDAELDFDAVVCQSALLTIHGPKEKRYVNGLVSRVEQIGKDGKWTQYLAEVVPAIFILSHRYNCRIFQNQNIPDIIKQVLTDGGISSDQFRFSLKNEYKPRDYCVQYRESDLSFITRLMEQYGMFYFFEHTEENHVMVIGDDAVVHVLVPDPSTIIYHAPGGTGVSDQEHIYEFRFNQEIRSGAVRLQDFDFKKPRLNLGADAQANGDGKFEVYDYPGEYQIPDEGKDLVKVRLEEFQATRQVGSGQSDCRHLIPGYRFTLDNYSRSGLNREYLLIQVSHSGSQPQALGVEGAGEEGTAYQNQFECIPSDVTFRPPRVTPKPVIQGPQTAIVVGPSGEEIYTDEHGRVKVQFHWDREGQRDEKSSCWVRVSQAWAGSGWGAMFIPRIGQEVIVEFMEGDPDQPIITGRVYNGDNMPPYALPGEKTKSTIMSNTSKGGGSANELLMEDNQGKTQVVISNAYGHKITEDEETQSLTIKTRDKHTIHLDDKNRSISIKTTNAHTVLMEDTETEGKGKITVQTTNGHVIEMDDKGKTMRSQTTDGHTILMDDENKKVEITTVSGHTAVLDDDKEAIGITSSKGHYITIDDSGDYIVLEDSGGSHRFKIDIGGSTLEIATDSGSINIEAPSGTIKLDATDVEISASNELKMSGGSKGTFDGGIESSVKGITTKIEGSAMTEVKGALVKIN